MRTNGIGDGITPGAEVRLNGVKVGRIDEIAGQPNGQQLITLTLKPSELFGLTDSFDVNYAPSNLFGISEVTIKRRSGGTPLRGGELIDLTAPGRVQDVTMGNLLRQMAAVTTEVLTPELTRLLTQASANIAAFTPMIQAIMSVSRSVADTQRYPSSFLIAQFASFLNGTGIFAENTIKLINEVYHLDALRDPRFDIGVSLVVDQLFPMISDLGWTAKADFNGWSDGLGVLVGQLAEMVPAPARSSADLAELLNRLDASFQDTPNGPQLGLDVVLRGVPAVAVPLLGGKTLPAPTPSGGQR
ncbi:MCE family protein [Nocardia cyriacigeorgica]|uniref:MCE family protein n=1 Tax=Nocardia cyriacigeorgica TaxID=135487 RepID=A0A5R8P5M0_9NOCA|nr:MCE family protein [Nocardia cyriacigeorgica]